MALLLTSSKEIKKNVFASLLVFMVILMAGCSGNNGDPSSADSGEGEDDGLSGEIEVWSWGAAADSLQLAADAFMEENPGTEITVEKNPNSKIYEQLIIGLSGGGAGLPDVITLESSRLPGIMSKFPEGLMNLSERGFDEHEDKFTEYKIPLVQNEEGNFYAAPWDVSPTAVFYRTDYFEEAGVDPEAIKTWDDYIQAAEKIKEATGNYILPIESYNPLRSLIQQHGTYYFNEEGKVNVASEEVVQTVELLDKLNDKDLAYRANNWDAMMSAIVNGEVATIPTGAWFAGILMDQAPDQKGKWDVFKLPAYEEGGVRAASGAGANLSVLAETENPELAYAFTEFAMTNEEIQLEILKEYGIFPSLVTTYDEPYFKEESEYFNNSPIFNLFAEVAESAKPYNFTSDAARAENIILDAQDSILIDDADVSEALESAAERIANETGREIAE